MKGIAESLMLGPEDISKAYSVVNLSAMEDLDSMGIYIADDPVRDRPSQYDGTIPTNLDMMTNDELAHLMVIHQSWTAYLNGCHSASVASKKVAERILKGVKSSIEQERGKEWVLSDPRFIKADAQLLFNDLKTEIIADALKAARNGYQLMSRLISLREQDTNQTTRRHVLTGSRLGRNR